MNMTGAGDTIAAIATATARAGIGIIRLSGGRAIDIADSVFHGRTRLSDAATHTIHYGYICDGDERIDEAMVSIFRAPHSYTTEDVAEINCHGGLFILERVLTLLCERGARLAEPGEFTKRAFLGGRIDLAQAESVMRLISSESELSRKSAMGQLSGDFSREIAEIRDELLSAVAQIEASLDDPEHIPTEDFIGDYPERMEALKSRIERILIASRNGIVLSEGIPAVIIGRPNVGKSSLWNRLVGRDLAIVTEIPGTTRDVLQETVRVGDITLRLSDTAGIRDTEDVVEGLGVERARSAMETASLVLAVIDGSQPLNDEDIEILRSAGESGVIVLLNKSDLGSVVAAEDVVEQISYMPPIVDISAMDGTGLDELAEVIRGMYLTEDIAEGESAITISARHIDLLRSAAESLGLVVRGLEDGVSEELIAVDIMDAYRSLGLIIGAEVGDDLVDRIFSEFCMGK